MIIKMHSNRMPTARPLKLPSRGWCLPGGGGCLTRGVSVKGVSTWGCLPRWQVSAWGCLPRRCLPRRVSTWGGGGACLGGVCLEGDVCLGGVCLGGVCLGGVCQGGVCQGGVCLGGVSVHGDVCLGGVCPGGCLPSGCLPHTPREQNDLTDRCKHITLPQNSFVGGNNRLLSVHAVQIPNFPGMGCQENVLPKSA